MSFRDKDRWIHAHKNVFNSENAILFTAIHFSLQRQVMGFSFFSQYIRYAALDGDHTPYKLSLDNVNGCCLYFGEYLNRLYDKMPWYVRMRPDNYFTWNRSMGRIRGFLALPFASLQMMYSCWKRVDVKPEGEGENRIYKEIPATSGKIQVWTRLRAVNMPITKLICTYLVLRNFDSWKHVFATYFDEGHPLRSFNKKEYIP